MSRNLHFERISIRQMPGFDRGGWQLEGFSPSINIVFGPNESGKTTLAHSIASILWPESSPDHAHLEAELFVDDKRYSALHQYGNTEISPGETISELNIPPATTRDRYVLALQTLMRSDNRDFAELIRRESSGGYSIEALRDEIEMRSKPSRKLSLTNKVEKLQSEIQSAHRDEQTLRHESEKLVETERRLYELDDLERKAKLLDKLIEYRDLEEKWSDIQQQLDSLPEVVSELHGEEYERVKELNDQIADLEEDLRDQKTKIEQLDDKKGKISLDKDTSSQKLKTLQKRLETVKSLKRDIDRDRRELKQLEGKKDRLAEFLGEDLTAGVFEDLDAETIREAKQIRKRLDKIDWLENKLNEFKGVLAPDNSAKENNEDALREGISLLGEWLKRPTRQTFLSRKNMGIAVAGLLLAGVAAVFVSWWILIGYLIGLFALGVIEFWRQPNRPPNESIAKQYESLDLPQPNEWNVENIQSLLGQLQQNLGEEIIERRKREELKRVEAGIDSEKKAFLKKKLGDLLDDINLKSAEILDDDERIIDRIFEVQKLSESVSSQVNVIEDSKAELQNEKKRLIEQIRQLGGQPGESIESLESALEQLDNNWSRLNELDAELDSLKREKTNLENRLESLKEQRKELFQKAHLAVGQLAELEALCSNVETFRDANQQRKQIDGELEKLENELNAFTDLNAEIMERTRRELETEKETIEKKLSGRQKLIEEKSSIETRIDEAKKSNNLEDLLVRRDRAVSELGERRQKDYLDLTTALLTEFVEEQTRDRDRPRVFHRARSRLAHLTNHRYRLDFDSRQSRFMAYDEQVGRMKQLDELSSGTRLQLLVSIRLAFIETRETGLTIPLVFDEALANSDRYRARAIIDAAVEMSKEGRQVFYMTAQRDELARWRHQLDEENTDYRVVELESDRQIESKPTTWRGFEETTDIPSPHNRTHEEYRNLLNLPEFDLWEPASKLHLWYLTESPEELAGLLKARITSWGQFKHLYTESNPESFGVSEDEANRIFALGKAVEHLCEFWRIGRGRPVPDKVIRESESVTERFESEVLERLHKSHRDATDLIEKLKDGAVNYFQTSKIEQLEDEFIEEGYIDRRTPLGEKQLRTRITAQLDTFFESDMLRPADLENLFERLGIQSNTPEAR